MKRLLRLRMILWIKHKMLWLKLLALATQTAQKKLKGIKI